MSTLPFFNLNFFFCYVPRQVPHCALHPVLPLTIWVTSVLNGKQSIPRPLFSPVMKYGAYYRCSHSEDGCSGSEQCPEGQRWSSLKMAICCLWIIFSIIGYRWPELRVTRSVNCDVISRFILLFTDFHMLTTTSPDFLVFSSRTFFNQFVRRRLAQQLLVTQTGKFVYKCWRKRNCGRKIFRL